MPTIDDLRVSTPQYEEVAAQCRELETALDAASSAETAAGVVRRWDDLRRQLETWSALVELRFNQDTGNEEFKKAREYRDELAPRLTDLEVRIKRKLLSGPLRPQLEERLGRQAFALWEADVMAFD